jgi:general secretion pathway protein L
MAPTAMNFIRLGAEGFGRWIDCVAGAIAGARMRLGSLPTVRLIEESGGAFALDVARQDADAGAGSERIQIVDGQVSGELAADVARHLQSSRVELHLQPSRFIFRPLELPVRAKEFLEGIVRTQIDRLTPWSPADAAFGWSSPREIANDRIVVTVAATARQMIAPFVEAVAHLGVRAVEVFTYLEGFDGDDGVVKVFEHTVKGALDVGRIRRALIAMLALVTITAGASSIADATLGGALEARQLDVSRRIAVWRTSAFADQRSPGDSAVAALQRRKRETPLSVIVLEALSQALPDNTYVTELRIIGDKMQVIGVTGDAPALIRLIEQSPHFTRATFFAPTTRSPSEPGEHFHIEAHVEPTQPERK